MSSSKNIEKTDLDKAIDRIHTEMRDAHSSEEDFAKMVDQLTKLHALKNETRFKRPSADTLAIVTGNVLVTAMIVGHERANVVTTKALSFLMKLR